MANYATIAGKTRRAKATSTPQTKKIPGRKAEQKKNAAGGVSFKMDPFARLQRFLILGVEGNTYYQTQKALVRENVKCLNKCLKADGARVVDMVIETQGRAFKQDAGLFVLAAAASYEVDMKAPVRPTFEKGGDLEAFDEATVLFEQQQDAYEKAAEVRKYALANLHRVARTGYSLYRFAGMVKEMRGFGRALRRAFANWMTKTPVEKLAYQSWKYKQRDGWSMRDLMRLSHPMTDDMVRSEIFEYMARPKESALCGKSDDLNSDIYKKNGKVRSAEKFASLRQIEAAETLLHLEGDSKATVAKAIQLITDHRLTHEAIPSHLRKQPEIWEALLQDMPVTAMLRNLGSMTANGLLTPMSASQKMVVTDLTNAEKIERSGAHPMQFLIAARQYSMGRGTRGNLTWTPNQKVLDALDGAYYASFGNVPVTGQNILVAVDTSGSMSSTWGGGGVMGIDGFSPLMAAAAFALVTLSVEPNSHLIGFDTSYHEMKVTSKKRIDDVLKALSRHQGGGTNTALPVKYAMDKNLNVDAIVSYTDNETWAGHGYYGFGRSGTGHVTEEVKKYEAKYGPTRFLNCAMTATGTSDVDPKNVSMFELVGMDANTPRIISEYVQGNL